MQCSDRIDAHNVLDIVTLGTGAGIDLAPPLSLSLDGKVCQGPALDQMPKITAHSAAASVTPIEEGRQTWRESLAP